MRLIDIMQRVFAHRIIYNGVAYDNHVAQLDDSGCITIFPFKEEIPSTRFISGTIELIVETKSDGIPFFRIIPR